MNSVSRHLGVENLAATLIAMRSGRKEVFLIVEGSSDIYLYSNILGLPKSNFLSCNGRERLEALYAMAPVRGLDCGTVFIRDRDCGDASHVEMGGVLLLTTDLYDVEMQILNGKIFHRLFDEFMAHKAARFDSHVEYTKIVSEVAIVGAFRSYSHENDIGLKFSELNFDFMDHKTLKIDIVEMVRKVYARSRLRLDDPDVVYKYIEREVQRISDPSIISRGKDFLEILHIALNRYYKCCDSSECSVPVLSRSIRIAATFSDLSNMSMMERLATWLEACSFRWTGRTDLKAA